MKYSSLLPILCATFSLSSVRGNPYTISDDRVRGMDITPALGRGYSIMTNTYQSTCLSVEEVTVPSYNYDYYFTDLTTGADSETALSGKVSTSFAFASIEAEASAEASSTSKVSTMSQTVVATMRIERYYSSVREDQSPLADDAITLLGAQDYVGFFKACGPNYVRGIRRAQELTAIFKFSTTSTEAASQFAASMQVSSGSYGFGAEMNSSSKHNSAKSSLKIRILGYGLGLNQEGSDTLVATTMEDYQAVLQFAFKSATQNEDSHNIGMVYGIEVVPWVNNLSFQVNAKLLDEVVVIDLPRSLIPKAFATADGTTEFEVGGNREDFQCKEPSFVFDKFGYCCEPLWLWDQATLTYDPTLDPAADDSTAICKPKRDLDKGLVKDNMSNNGEFISRLDGALRYRMATIGQLEHCISSARSYPSDFDYHILKVHDSVKYDRTLDVLMTLVELKKAVDPKDDYGLLRHLTRELDEWIKMFYSPCIGALYGMNIDSSSQTDSVFFMAYPWYEHSECMHLACLTNSMRWDRANGGCVTGMIAGRGATAYGDAAAELFYCSTDPDSTDLTQLVCDYETDELTQFYNDATTCWSRDADLEIGSIDYFLNNFCQPILTGDVIDDNTRGLLETSIANNCAPN